MKIQKEITLQDTAKLSKIVELARYYLAEYYSDGGGAGALFLDFFLKKVPVILFLSNAFLILEVPAGGVSGGGDDISLSGDGVISLSGEGDGDDLSGGGEVGDSVVDCRLLAARSHHNFINLKFSFR